MSKTKEKKGVDEPTSVMLSKFSENIEVQTLIESGAIPSTLDTAEKIMTVMQTGKEMGMGPMTTINNVNIIKGRTVISASGVGAMLKRAGKEWIWTKDFETVEENGKVKQITEIEFEWISPVTNKPKQARFSVSWQEMELAGYTAKPNWQKMPKPMMRARCLSAAIRALFPEILLGVYTDLEIADSPIKGYEDETYKTELSEEGDVIIIQETEKDDEQSFE
jgi:hypothetical protein